MNKEEFRILDPIKISMTGLSMFIKKYGVRENATLTHRLERIEQLSKEASVPESAKKDMKSILEDLNKIMKCELCHKEINWDKGDLSKGEMSQGIYSIEPTINARHTSCHKKVE